MNSFASTMMILRTETGVTLRTADGTLHVEMGDDESERLRDWLCVHFGPPSPDAACNCSFCIARALN